MKSHLWNLWGRKFIIDSTMTPKGTGILVEKREYKVCVQQDDEWMPVKEDVAIGVLLSFLRRRDSAAKEKMAEEFIPETVRKGMGQVSRQFGVSRDAEANAYALCVLSAQWNGTIETKSLRETR